ncbi:MAG: hypothetical protein IKZ02_00745, partial [Alphaproteobacteria bacterium]|nr:hypothetical protein [Alphaproteobacteria bacterium]
MFIRYFPFLPVELTFFDVPFVTDFTVFVEIGLAIAFSANFLGVFGFERLLMPQKPSKTGREKIASSIRKADATTAAEEETRLQ